MLGQVKWCAGHKVKIAEEKQSGMKIVTLYLPEGQRRAAHNLKKGIRLLLREQVTRVLTPMGFSNWPQLMERGLHPVDTQMLRCALADVWVQAVLASKGIQPENAVLCLRGPRESQAMAQVARKLCPMVRNIVIETPGDGTLAMCLQREYGLAMLPARSKRADLTLFFDSGPVLSNATFYAQGVSLPMEYDPLPLLSVLWESGEIRLEQIRVSLICG